MSDLEAAREAYASRAWPTAVARFEAARADGPLGAEDLAALADAAWWVGDLERSLSVGAEAFAMFVEEDQLRRAAMTALTIGINRLLRGEEVIGSGWLQRAARLLEDDRDGVEAGYLRYVLEVEATLGSGGAVDEVVAGAREVQDIGRRHGDRNLVALGILGEGRARLEAGELHEGLGLLDEAMLAVLSDDLDPAWAGNLYCNLMAACHEIAEFRRAVAWTEATSRWLETLPAAAVFTGICRVHRSQVLQLTGGWDAAEREARQVCEDLDGIHVATTAEGHYQLGELRRLRGDLHGAEAAYVQAQRHGRDPQPGMALLRLAQGRAAAAASSIRAALAAAPEHGPTRIRLHAAKAQIALADGDDDAASDALGALERLIVDYPTCGFEALGRQLRGAALLRWGQPVDALPLLREAADGWRGIDARYELACTGLLLAEALEGAGDADGARRERETATATFRQLGAVTPEHAWTGSPPPAPGGLTDREVEVLRLVASGRTNREVAATLVISEKTVARHLSNIFSKLDVTSRTAAAAFAFEHGLAERRPG